MPFRYLQIAADELRCSVMDAASADPEWRHWAIIKRLAELQVEEKKRKNGATAK